MAADERDVPQEGLTPTSNFIDKIALETVNLRFHGLKPAMVRAIAEALKLNQFVRSIDLAENIVGDTAGYAMAEVLAVNTVLTELDISGTGMTAKSAIPFARMLERGNRTLTKLRMNSNAIGDRGGAAIAHALERNTILAQLDLSRCRIGAAGATALGNALLVDAGLRGLDLAWNDLHNAGADAIVAGLESSFLHTINLSYCGMGDAAGVALGEALGDNGTLTSLDCSHNRLERAAAEALAAALRSNTTLKALRMGFNPIGYDGTAAVLAALEDNLAITVLGLENTLVCIDMQPRDLAKEAREKAAEEAARKAAAEAGDKKKGGKGKAPAGKGKVRSWRLFLAPCPLPVARCPLCCRTTSLTHAGVAPQQKGKKEEAPPGPPPEPEPPKPPKPTVAWCYAQLEEVLSRRPKLARVMLEFPYIGPPEHGGADKYPPIAEAEAKARAGACAPWHQHPLPSLA